VNQVVALGLGEKSLKNCFIKLFLVHRSYEFRTIRHAIKFLFNVFNDTNYMHLKEWKLLWLWIWSKVIKTRFNYFLLFPAKCEMGGTGRVCDWRDEGVKG